MRLRDKSKEDQLKAIKRAAKSNRLKMANKMGFDTVEAYIASLTDGSMPTAVVATPITGPEKSDGSGEIIDIVISFDDTGSMSSYRNEVKKKVKDLINFLFKHISNLRMKVVVHGDYCDMVDFKKNIFGKAYQVIELTDNVDNLIKFVNNAQSTSGGDGDEFYALVINKIVNETMWRGGKKICIFIGDCASHAVGRTGDGFDNTYDINVEIDNAQKNHVVFHAINCGNLDWYKRLASITDGVHLAFRDSAKLTEILTGIALAEGNKVAFAKKMKEVEASGDAVMTGYYKQLSTIK